MFTPRPKPWYFSTGKTLIVVHRQHRVGVIEIFRLKQGIGRQRPVEFHPLRPQLIEHRNNGVYLFPLPI